MVTGHVFIAVSLDGFIAKMDGDINWLLKRDDPSEDHGFNSFNETIDGVIMGRNTFEKVIALEEWFYTKPVIVLSKGLSFSDVPEKLIGKVSIVDSSPLDLFESLKINGWKKIYVDGGKVIQSFLRANLIEDMTITTIPVLLGEGRPLFGYLKEEVSLKHISTVTFPSGLVQSKYQVCYNQK